jgi:hypothetical protein
LRGATRTGSVDTFPLRGIRCDDGGQRTGPSPRLGGKFPGHLSSRIKVKSTRLRSVRLDFRTVDERRGAHGQPVGAPNHVQITGQPEMRPGAGLAGSWFHSREPMQPDGNASADRWKGTKAVTQGPPGMTTGIGSRSRKACQQLGTDRRTSGFASGQDIDFAPVSDNKSVAAPIGCHRVHKNAAHRMDPDRGFIARQSRPADPCFPAIERHVKPALVSEVTQTNRKSQTIQQVQAIKSRLAVEVILQCRRDLFRGEVALRACVKAEILSGYRAWTRASRAEPVVLTRCPDAACSRWSTSRSPGYITMISGRSPPTKLRA